MRILVIGSGGREHAIVRALSPDTDSLHAAPGNPGIAALAEIHSGTDPTPAGILALARKLRPDLVVILDFYHAASYLEKLAKALHPSDPTQAKSQAEAWCRLLKEEGGATTLAVLRTWAWPARWPAALRQQWEDTQTYFSKNVHRMEYPEYEAEGWQIGSGVVESACKTVVGQRLKGAGMRWGEDGAHALCHVRALYRSEKGQWDAFWKRHYTKRANVQQSK